MLRHLKSGLASACQDDWWLFVFGLVLTFSRNPLLFLFPIAGWEDATQGLNFYTRPNATVLHFYAQYVSLLPNLIGWLSVRLLDLYLVPIVFAVCSLIIAALIPVALASFFRNCAGRTRSTAGVLAMVTACIPVDDFSLISNLEFSIWHMLAILLLTIFNPIPSQPFRMLVYIGWRALLLMSIPLSVLALPFWAMLAWRLRRHRATLAVYGCLIILEVLYLHYGLNRTPAVGSVVDRLPAIVSGAFGLAIGKSMLALLAHGIFSIDLKSIPTMLLAASACTVLAGIGYVHFYSADRLANFRSLASLGVLIAGASLLCSITRGTQMGNSALLASPRYNYLPKLLWSVVFVLTMAETLNSRNAIDRRLSGSWVGIALRTFAVAAFVSIWIRGLKAYRWNEIAQSRAVAAFLQKSEDAFQSGRAGPFRLERVDASGDWSIVLYSPV